MVLVLRAAYIFVEKRGECGIVIVYMVIEISRRVSDERKVDDITIELRNTDGFEAFERVSRQRRRRRQR